SFEVAGRIDEALDMAAGAEHEFDSSAEHPRRTIAPAPGADMVGHTGNQIEVILHGAQIDRRAENRDAAAARERISEKQIEKARLQFGRKIGRVGVPIEDVEWRG